MAATRKLIVVGAGLGGVSAALWARTLGFDVVVLESGPTAGGQLHRVHFRPVNFASHVEGEGPALAARLAEQLVEAGVSVRYGATATALEVGATATALEVGAPAVRSATGERLEADAVLIATGVRRRRLDVPGDRELDGRGVSYSATQDRTRFAGEEVVVVGGGDAAFENALLLADVSCKVTIVVRGHPRARREFRERVAAERRIEVLDQTRVVAVEGDERARAVRLEGPGGTFELPTAGVVVKIGVVPNTEWCAAAAERDPDGYLRVDGEFRTSHERAWAVGDVTRPRVFGMAVAVGQGALAMAGIRRVLDSSDPTRASPSRYSS